MLVSYTYNNVSTCSLNMSQSSIVIPHATVHKPYKCIHCDCIAPIGFTRLVMMPFRNEVPNIAFCRFKLICVTPTTKNKNIGNWHEFDNKHGSRRSKNNEVLSIDLLLAHNRQICSQLDNSVYYKLLHRLDIHGNGGDRF